MNPILRKELRLGSRSIKIPLALMFYNIVLALIAVVMIFSVNAVGGISGAFSSNGDAIDFSGFLYIFQVIGWTQLGITLLIVPILSAGSISGEREKQTLEIMLTTPEKPFSIIWGKLLASLSNFIMFIVTSIPIMAISFLKSDSFSFLYDSSFFTPCNLKEECFQIAFLSVESADFHAT